MHFLKTIALAAMTACASLMGSNAYAEPFYGNWRTPAVSSTVVGPSIGFGSGQSYFAPVPFLASPPIFLPRPQYGTSGFPVGVGSRGQQPVLSVTSSSTGNVPGADEN